MGIATHWLAAIAIVGEQLGFVADADLSHLDSGLQGTGEVFNKLSKVDPLFRHIIKNHPLTAEDGLHVHEIHLQTTLRGKLPAGSETFLDAVPQAALDGDVFGCGNPEDLASKRIFEESGRPIGRRAEDFAKLGSSIAPDDHALPSGVGLSFNTIVFAKMTHLATSDYESIHGEWNSAWGPMGSHRLGRTGHRFHQQERRAFLIRQDA